MIFAETPADFLTNAIFIANLFIDKGKLVSIVGRNGYKYDIMAQDTNFQVEKPIILLVNGSSASASEILSGAMKDYHKAKNYWYQNLWKRYGSKNYTYA